MSEVSLTGWMKALIAYVRSGEPDLTNRQMALLMLVYLTPGPAHGARPRPGSRRFEAGRHSRLEYARRARLSAPRDGTRTTGATCSSSAPATGQIFLKGSSATSARATAAPRPTGRSSARPPPTPTSADEFALTGSVGPAGSRIQRLSQGSRRRRARRSGDRLALCRAGRAPAAHRSDLAARSAVGRRERRSANLAPASRSRCSTTASAGPGAMPGEERRVGYVPSEALASQETEVCSQTSVIEAASRRARRARAISAQSRAGQFGRRAGNSSQAASARQDERPDRAVAHEDDDRACGHARCPWRDRSRRAGSSSARRAPGDHRREQKQAPMNIRPRPIPRFLTSAPAGAGSRYHLATLAFCSASVSANTCPPVPSATK